MKLGVCSLNGFPLESSLPSEMGVTGGGGLGSWRPVRGQYLGRRTPGAAGASRDDPRSRSMPASWSCQQPHWPQTPGGWPGSPGV